MIAQPFGSPAPHHPQHRAGLGADLAGLRTARRGGFERRVAGDHQCGRLIFIGPLCWPLDFLR